MFFWIVQRLEFFTLSSIWRHVPKAPLQRPSPPFRDGPNSLGPGLLVQSNPQMNLLQATKILAAIVEYLKNESLVLNFFS